MIWLRALCLATVTSLVRAQIWDLLYDDYDEQEEDSSIFDEYYIDENATYVLVMSSAQIRSERALYDECNEIIMEEVNFLLDDPEPFDTEHLNMTVIDELILDSTIELYNILHQQINEEPLKPHRIRFNDIFVWSNRTDEEINAMLEEYYHEG